MVPIQRNSLGSFNGDAIGAALSPSREAERIFRKAHLIATNVVKLRTILIIERCRERWFRNT